MATATVRATEPERQARAPVEEAETRDPVSLAERLARGAGVTLFIYAGGAAAGYVTQTLLARWIGAAGYGAFSWVATWAEILGLVAGLGLGAGSLRFVPQYAARGEMGLARAFTRFAYVTTGVATAFAGLALFMMPVPRLLAAQDLGGLWQVGAWLVPAIAVTQLQMQLARARGHVFLAFAPRMLLRHLVFLALAAWVLIAGSGIDATMAMQMTLVAYALVLVGQAAVLGRSRRTAHGVESPVEHGASTVSQPPVGEWMRVSTALLFGSVFILVQQRTDVLVLGLMGDAADVGVYNAASKTAGLASFVLIAANAAVAPSISALHATGRRHELQRLLSRFGRWIGSLSALLVLAIAFAGHWVLAVFGPEFTAGVVPLVVLLSGYLVAAGCGLVLDLLNLTGHQNTVLRVVIGATVANALLNVLFIRAWGMTGAAIATAIAMGGMYIVLHRQAVSRTGIDPSGITALVRWRFGSTRAEPRACNRGDV